MSHKAEFLPEIVPRLWSPNTRYGLHPVALFVGQGANALEIAVAQASQAPTRSVLVEIWKARKGRRAAPLLLVVLLTDSVSLIGATGEVPPVYEDMDVGQVERLCREVLDQPDRHAALRLLSQALPSLETALWSNPQGNCPGARRSAGNVRGCGTRAWKRRRTGRF